MSSFRGVLVVLNLLVMVLALEDAVKLLEGEASQLDRRKCCRLRLKLKRERLACRAPHLMLRIASLKDSTM